MGTNNIQNRILHITIDAIPLERWYKKKPSIKHLKCFGCNIYLERKGTNHWAKKRYFVGYRYNSSNYRIWLPDDDTIMESMSKKGIFGSFRYNSSSNRIWLPGDDTIMESNCDTFQEHLMARQTRNPQHKTSNFNDELSFSGPNLRDILL